MIKPLKMKALFLLCFSFVLVANLTAQTPFQQRLSEAGISLTKQKVSYDPTCRVSQRYY